MFLLHGFYFESITKIHSAILNQDFLERVEFSIINEMSEFQSRHHSKITKEGRIHFNETSNKFLRPRIVTKT